MTEKIARRGVKTPDSYEPDLLEKITVRQVVKDHGIVLSEESSIKEVRAWLEKQEGYKNNYYIISNKKGEFTGILSSSNLFSHHHNSDNCIRTIVRRKNISLENDQSLRTAIELMAKENVDVLPVLSKENNKSITGILSYLDILGAYKINEHERQVPNISLKMRSMKILLRGQKIFSSVKQKSSSHS